jgi:DNA-binding HxlR family transcriptional regulator
MSFKAYIDNIRAKTGKSPADFKQLATQKGWMEGGKLRAQVKAAEVVAWLKTDFALGHGHAMAIVAILKGAKAAQDKQATTAFLEAEEGIASNILTERLQRLECAGIVVKRRDAEDARRFVYRLTEKGMALAPVLVELVLWSARFEQTDAPPAAVKLMRTDRDALIAWARQAWKASNRA